MANDVNVSSGWVVCTFRFLKVSVVSYRALATLGSYGGAYGSSLLGGFMALYSSKTSFKYYGRSVVLVVA
jgi:hypothetical protein